MFCGAERIAAKTDPFTITAALLAAILAIAADVVIIKKRVFKK